MEYPLRKLPSATAAAALITFTILNAAPASAGILAKLPGANYLVWLEMAAHLSTKPYLF